ncbi:4-hydroxy-tetrahydrodipicolinate synthase [Cnuella takakiae]|uniref:4-hydroxy-tetrahydrodipicolinate synthase n=1 Tax=Cnuella takakiae TaxID=1302690 RepID=A0A1M4S923_9BACT|nr:dihydrodipicolinate synthase family protein [Cnuella takakiae]OLY94425.1 dihydrodipicolinate synthase family protein [Cnuella takakiae]SHE28709.1 4-hydroxy-tetrahydrodipicolinate synthase [Cnuella takakiae]
MNPISWKGVYPAVLTPFLQNEAIDYDTFKINIEAQLEAGVDGIILSGSLGEASTLTAQDKIDLLVYTKELVQGRVPVVMNIAEQATAAAVQAAKDAEANGADGLMLLPPMRYKADDAETVQFFKDVAAATSLSIMLYNNPVDYKIAVTLDMFEELASVPNINAVKESSRDISNITRMINRFGDRFSIMCGVDPLAMESLVMGADGWVAGLVDAFPRETVAIYRLVKAERYAEALKIYRWFLPVLELDIHPKLVQYIKLAGKLTGISTEYVRRPRLELTGAERASVIAIVEEALANRPVLPDYLHLEETETWQTAVI